MDGWMEGGKRLSLWTASIEAEDGLFSLCLTPGRLNRKEVQGCSDAAEREKPEQGKSRVRLIEASRGVLGGGCPAQGECLHSGNDNQHFMYFSFWSINH